MNLFRTVYNARGELERNLRVNLRKQLRSFRNNHVRRYIQMCFDQSVKFLDSFLQSPIEISPLTAFYSILNLSKVHVLLRINKYDIRIEDVQRLFSAHGASSTSIEKVRVNSSGTFFNLAQLYWPTVDQKKGNEYSLHELYRNITDLKELLSKVHSETSNFVEVIVSEDFSAIPFRMSQSITEIGFMVPTTERDRVQSALNAGWSVNDIEGWSHFRKDVGSHHEFDRLREYYKLFSFSMDRHFFLNTKTDPNDFIPELCSIYLVLLKYSSLVRYQPKNWKEKTESSDRVIIDKFCDQCVLKYWSIITTIDSGVYEYIV